MPGGAPALRGIDFFAGGPVGWYILFLYGLTMLLAVFVMIDSLRPARRARLAELPEPAWMYANFQAAFLIFAVFGGGVPLLPRWVALIPVAMTPFALAEQVAYLLRVVFPKAHVPAAPEDPERLQP